MSDAELEQRARDYALKHARQYYSNDKSRLTEEEVYQAYLAAARDTEVFLKENTMSRKFDLNRILTAVTADKATVGTRGYFADSLDELKDAFEDNKLRTLVAVQSSVWTFRFEAEHGEFALFYPIEE
jgi:hypothetical protein